LTVTIGRAHGLKRVDVSFDSVAIVAAIAFGAPLLLGLLPGVRLPAPVLELVAGIVVGPAVLGWAHDDTAVSVLALVGLAFLLLLSGLEIDFDRLRGALLRVALAAFAVSFALALGVGLVLDAAGLVGSPLLIAIVLSATSLGVVIPVLKDSGRAESAFGQLTIAGASIADVLSVVLLSLFFSGHSSGVGAKIVLLVAFVALAAAVAFAVLGAEHSRRLSAVLLRLQDTTAQIRVRGAFLLLVLLVALAERFGLEAILGAFMAGAVLKLVDRDEMTTHPEFRHKLEAVGFGVFVPFFFVTSGIRFDLDALLHDGSALARVPIFLAALVLVRGLPALLYRRLLPARETVAAGLLQATSLSFLVVSAQIGTELGLISAATGAALVAAGLLSVVLFPLTALTVLGREETATAAASPA
jgi:Kef-type K+ transport system membrane component KefB